MRYRALVNALLVDSLLIASVPRYAAFSASLVLVWGVFQRSIVVLSAPEHHLPTFSPFLFSLGRGRALLSDCTKA